MADTQSTEAGPVYPPPYSPSSRWRPLVVAFDNKLLSGYSKDTVIRLGKGSFAGTQTTARCIWGPHVPPHIEIKVYIQDGTASTQVLRATIKLQSLKAPAEYIVIDSSETDTLNRCLPFEKQDLDGLRDGRIDRHDAEQFDALTFASADPTIAEYLPALASEIVNIRFDVKKGDMTVLPSSWFVAHMRDHPAAVQTHAQAIIDAFEMNNTPSSTIMFAFPGGNEWKNAWNGAFESASHLTPFRDICANVRGGTADDLALKNLDLSNLQQPVRSNPATDMFLSRDHRTVALIVGSAEDLAYQRYREEKLFSINIQGRAFADPTSVVQPNDQDINTYGVRMDGTIMMHQYIAIPLAGIRDLCPDIGTQVSMYLRVPHETHPVPEGLVLSAAQKQDMASSLEAELRNAQSRAEAAQENIQQQLDRLMSKAEPNEDKVAEKERQLRTIYNKVYYRHAERYVYPYVKEVNPQSVAALPEESEDIQRWHSAKLLVDELAKGHDEDDIAWATRLLEWTSNQGTVVLPGATSEFGDAFRGFRIPLPYGIRADVALFSIQTPRQTKWIRGFQRPPMKYHIPMTPLTGDLQTTFVNLFDNHGRGTQSNSTFQLRMWYEESDTTTNQECRAVTALNSVGEDTSVHQWWKYIIDFTQPDLMDTGNLLTAFPELAARVESGEYDNDPDTKAAMEFLKATRAGFVTVTGCPGAGKSTWATEVCDAVMQGPPIQAGWLSGTQTAFSTTGEDDQFEETPESKIELENQINQLVTSLDDTETGQSTWDQGVDQHQRIALEKLLERQRVATEAQARIDRMNRRLGLDEPTIIDAQSADEEQSNIAEDTDDDVEDSGDAHQLEGDDASSQDSDGGVDAWGANDIDENLGNTDVNVPAVEPVIAPGWETASDDGIDAADVDEVGQIDAQNQATSGRCAWVTPTNRLAFDACQRLGRKSVDKRIVHIFPWERETFNALNEEASMPEEPSEAAIQYLPWQDVAMVQHLSHYKATHWYEASPAADPNSLSEVAKNLAKNKPEEFADAIQAIFEFTHDKGTFKKNLAKNMQSIRELLEFALSKADCIVGTPVALSELMDHIKSWKPDVVVIDEAGRLNEAALMIPVANFVGVPLLILGDAKQCTPFNRTDDANDFNDLFGKQRKTSFLDRVSLVDAFDITLTGNHRSHGSVVDWALQHFYYGRMKIVNGRSQATREYHQYLQSLKEPPAEGNTIFLDVQCGQEEKVGTSFINPTNALIVRELAVQLFRDAPIRNMVDYVKHMKDEIFPVRRGTVMILTGYANQKRQYESIIDSISPAEIPFGHLTVRTIDDSVSAEADIVIVDLVRITKAGFMDDPKRVAVMTTRARLGQIFVGNGATFQWKNHLGSLFRTLQEKNSVVRIKAGGKGWETWCARCHQSGHEVITCQASPLCFSCDENGLDSGHAIRNCPNPIQPSEHYDGPIGELDNIHRNVVRFEKPEKFGGGKRVKLLQKRQRPQVIQVQREESAAEKRYREIQWTDEPERTPVGDTFDDGSVEDYGSDGQYQDEVGGSW